MFKLPSRKTRWLPELLPDHRGELGSRSEKKFDFQSQIATLDSYALLANMSTQTITKKRKSADGTTAAAKKVKVAASADKPAPKKSALKKPEAETTEVKTKTKTKPAATEQIEAKKSKSEAKPAKKKTEKVVIENDSENEEDGGAGTTLTADQTASLLAGFSSESEDNASEDESGIPASKLPKAPTTGDIQDRIAAATKASKTKDNDPETTPGIIYIGRLPHGFHEPQMRSYFSQFGDLTHLKLARNRKTGKSKHFAFIEFASSSVADIVVKTMDKYLLFGHVLQVRRVREEDIKAEDRGRLWRGEGRRGWNVKPHNKLERGHLRRGKSREAWESKVGREERRRSRKAEKLGEMGYQFEMPGLKPVSEVAVKPKAVEEPAAAEAGPQETAVPEEAVEEKVVGAEEDGADVVAEKKTRAKKRAADGKPRVKEAKKVVKKVKT